MIARIAAEVHDLLDILQDPDVSSPQKEQAILSVITKASTFFDAVARRYAVYPGLDRVRDFDDLRQIVVTQAWLILRDMANGEIAHRNFEAMLSMKAHAAIRDYADSGQVTMIARGGAASRRLRSEIAQRELNDRLAPIGDGVAPTVVFGIDYERASEIDASAHLEMQYSIERTLSEIAKFESATLYAVAQMMLEWFPNAKPPSVIDIARELHIPATTAKRRCLEVSEIFKKVHTANESV